ncbi:hypothetical protein HHL17_13035 [Chitinophaga sp. G-6-1-13]|uniref:ADP-ribosylglycohydrolase n=1 Tax=Chitinophaga fulva TaxID=2728842 RepID=A0A848GMV3_9BACT|nr:ADP-ribosylglycohydrolase family protein [Chitinophaga fulva]NML38123.1 hypothetical protein [Chitinophaga fulva]
MSKIPQKSAKALSSTMMKPGTPELAWQSLWGLSIGDAFGETFFGKETVIVERIAEKTLQDGEWLFTDDTVQGIGVFRTLSACGVIDQDFLAKELAHNYLLDDYRGYGGTAHSIMKNIAAGSPWQTVSQSVFDGMGSAGNGAAMRSGPIGAWFAGDPATVVAQARLAAEVTHAHPEAIAGAIAVALGACCCAEARANRTALTSSVFFDFIIHHLPESDIKYKIRKAATLPVSYDIRTVVSILGNGKLLTAADTVPFALWCAAHHLTHYENALWTAVSGLGDRDTIAAITGSIVVLYAGDDTIPAEWMTRAEKVDTSVFYKK